MRTTASLAAVILCALAHPALAFDCTKAQSRVEKAICADPTLKAKDDAMAARYGEVKDLSTPPEQKMLARSQVAWIGERETQCDAASDRELGLCIRGQINNRIAALSVKPESGPGTTGRLMPEFVRQDGAKRQFAVDYQLMRFVKPATPGEAAFNAAVAKIATAAPLGPQADLPDEEGLYDSTGLIYSYGSPRLMSVVVSSSRNEGGAHPNSSTDNINLDLATGKPLSFAKLFPASAARPLAKSCRDQIIAQKKDKMEGAAYDPATDDFLKDEVIAQSVADLRRWTLKAGESTITFDAYELGSYAEGPYDCSFPMKTLKALALPTANLPE